jgi:hypothetical protein
VVRLRLPRPAHARWVRVIMMMMMMTLMVMMTMTIITVKMMMVMVTAVVWCLRVSAALSSALECCRSVADFRDWWELRTYYIGVLIPALRRVEGRAADVLMLILVLGEAIWKQVCGRSCDVISPFCQSRQPAQVTQIAGLTVLSRKIAWCPSVFTVSGKLTHKRAVFDRFSDRGGVLSRGHGLHGDSCEDVRTGHAMVGVDKVVWHL